MAVCRGDFGGKFFSEDLAVVSDIHGQRRVANDDFFDPPGQRVARGQFQKFIMQLLPLLRGRRPVFLVRLDDHHRRLVGPLAARHQGRAEDCRMVVEDRFAGNREQRALTNHHAMRFAAAEPKSVAIVQVADVPHAMPNAVSISDLVQRILIAADDVTLGHHRSGDDQLADLASRQFFGVRDIVDRAIVDFDDPPLDTLESGTDAGALALGRRGACFGDHFAGFDRCDRQGFGRAVGCDNHRLGIDQRAKFFQRHCWNRCAGRIELA